MPADHARRITLSKSRFMAGVQCLKRLYLQVHQPELAEETRETVMAAMRRGLEVGELARKAFPGGVLVESGENRLTGALSQTSQLVADAKTSAIFEGAFKQDDILVKTDILERKPESGWRLVEVKSTKTVKEHHAYDVGIQQYVLNASTLEASPCLMHLNKDYLYDGKAHDLGRLFTIQEMGPAVEKLRDELPEMISLQREVLSRPEPPEIPAGAQCENPVRCEFYDHCNPELPDDHVSMLPSISAPRIGQLIEKSITSICDIPENFPLSDRQRRACQSVKTQTPYFGKGLKEAIDQLHYPLFFMDFETFSPPIPRFARMRPYDPIPFQWSVHTRRKPGGETTHDEFLAEDERDPRLSFLTSLIEVLGQEGNIVVYNQGFESKRLEELAGWFPGYADSIAMVQARLWDLLAVIRKHVYHPRFRGSFSLKYVLPALIPEMTYEGMDVSEGEEAGLAWETIVRGEASEKEKMQLRNALLEYCSQDTFAMVRLLDYLAEQA
jgi:Domain of unknown function(DUF2779)